MKTSVLELARGRWVEILSTVGGVPVSYLDNNHKPCPSCRDGDDRFRFDDLDGNGTWFCSHCGGRDGSGGGGNGMSLLMRVKGWEFKQAACAVEDYLGIQRPINPRPVTLRPIKPPVDAAPPALDGASHQWCYTDANGEQLFWIQRVNRSNGDKLFRPRTWVAGTGWQGERGTAWPAPRPLYNLAALAAQPTAQVIVCEGEKAADRAQQLFPRLVVVAWPNGAQSVTKADWKPLAGRNILLWPDNDDQGREAMAKVAALIPSPGKLLTIDPPPGAPEKWDIADADWTPAEALVYVKANHRPMELPTAAPDPEPEPEPIAPAKGGHFTCLGFDQEGYYYLPRNTGQVVRLVRSAHTGTNLCSLAPLAYWESLYPGKKEGVNWTWTAASLFEQQAAVGVYDPDRVRGRGAWIDDGRVIFHLGDRLIVDGRPISVLSPPPTRYFYEQARHLAGPGDAPLPDADAMRMRLIAERFRWEIPASAHFLLGWLVLAPVCGALNWRPHIWLTGGAGTGKTTILKAFLRPLLGGVVQSATGGTTEAGLRGTLKSDAIPVVFDEFEQNEQKDKLIVQNVLALARIASSEGGKIYKGTTSGGATSFEIRSMFCVSSINVSLIQKADIDRFCVLGLRKDTMEKNEWLDFEREIASVATIENGRALINRTLHHLPAIIQNARVLAQALGRRFGQRFGDQHGTLLAGAWSLEAGGGGLLDLVMADQWLDQMEWQHQQPDTAEADEIKCRDTILQQIVRLGGGSEASFGELVRCVVLQQSLSDTIWDQLVPVLGRYGMRVYRAGQQLPDGERGEGHFLAIANANAQLDHVLRNTPWSGGAHRAALKRISGAYLPNRTVHFAGVGSKRCVMVPLSSDELG